MANSSKQRCIFHMWAKRRYDEHYDQTLVQYCELLRRSGYSFSAHYFGWAELLVNDPLVINQIDSEPTQNILLFTHDNLQNNQILNLRDLINRWPDKKFILFTAMINLKIDTANLQIIHWGGDILFQHERYNNLLPTKIKNFNADKHWISLSYNPRQHRLLAGFFLLGLDLDKTGLLRFRQPTPLLASWNDFLLHNKVCSSFTDKSNLLLKKGFDKFQNSYPNFESADPYYQIARNDNVTNFDRNLRHFYKNSVVEIVNETLFTNTVGLITEKFRNSVWGFNFPIILSSVGTVSHLREIGFDMFDDIIDHSYDTINDPWGRIASAITNNVELLKDKSYAQSLWQKNYVRLENNYNFARNKMAEDYFNKSFEKFKDIVPKFFDNKWI